MAEIIRPTFWEPDFTFSDAIPAHNNLRPEMALMDDAYMVGIKYPGVETKVIAVDIPDKVMALMIVEARIRHQELIIRTGGIVEDIYLYRSSCGTAERLYQGWI